MKSNTNLSIPVKRLSSILGDMNPSKANKPINQSKTGIDIVPSLKTQHKPHNGNEKKIEQNADIDRLPKV